jgi:hypothetical protein
LQSIKGLRNLGKEGYIIRDLRSNPEAKYIKEGDLNDKELRIKKLIYKSNEKEL